jgi:hypothetical protein
MPEGYYSRDKPNPNLRAFVEAHLRERPYDPETDKYDVSRHLANRKIWLVFSPARLLV